MKNITVKNIPDALYKKLRDQAESHRRSVNKEVIHCLSQVLEAQEFDPETHLKKARRVQRFTDDHLLTDEELASAKTHGRP